MQGKEEAQRVTHPAHLTFLLFLGRTGEGGLEHGSNTDRTRIISTEDESVFVRSREILTCRKSTTFRIRTKQRTKG